MLTPELPLGQNKKRFIQHYTYKVYKNALMVSAYLLQHVGYTTCHPIPPIPIPMVIISARTNFLVGHLFSYNTAQTLGAHYESLPKTVSVIYNL